MKIAKVETFQIKTPRYYQEHPVQTGEWTGHVVVKLHVEDGLVGLGEAPDSLADDLGAIAARYNELLVGRGRHPDRGDQRVPAGAGLRQHGEQLAPDRGHRPGALRPQRQAARGAGL